MSGYNRFYLLGRQALLLSLETEDDFVPSLALVVEIAVEEGDRVQPPGVVAAMRTAATIMPDDPRPLLVLGRSDRREERFDEALQWFLQYQAVAGDPGVAGLETSRTLFALDAVDDAVAAYWSGLESPGPGGRALYRTDLTWVAIPDEIADYDRLDTEELAAWVADFWADRDAEALRPPGSRLREHLRRWVHVHGHYRVDRLEQRARLNPPWGFERILPCSDDRNATLDGVDFLNPSRPKDLRGWEPFLDNRAPIYMRHGEPIRRVWATHRFTTFPRNPWAFSTIFDGALGEAERTQAEFRQFARAEAGRATRFIPGIWAGWAHWIDGEPRLSFFTGSMALGLSAPTTMSFKIPAGQYWEMLELMADDVGLTGAARKDLARVRHDALLREAGFSRALPSARCMRANIRWLARAEADMRLTANTDGFVLLFPSSLFPTVQAYGLPGLQPEADGTILVVFSVPLSNLVQQERADGAAPVALRFRVSALDSTTGRRLWRDTTRLFDLTGHPEQNSHLSGYLEMNAPPGTYAVRVAIHQPDSLAGNAVDLLTPVVTWAPGSALELSDPVTGRHDDNTLYWFGQ